MKSSSGVAGSRRLRTLEPGERKEKKTTKENRFKNKRLSEISDKQNRMTEEYNRDLKI